MRKDHSPDSRLLEGSEVQNDELRAILFLLQTKLEAFKEEVDKSYDLYNKVGVLTDLSKEIKSVIDNPFKSVLSADKNIDKQVKHIINSFVSSYIHFKKDKVASAYRTKTPGGKLHYSVTLKNDSTDARIDFMEFFDRYFSFGIEEKYPVTFQFVPEQLISRINTLEKII